MKWTPQRHLILATAALALVTTTAAMASGCGGKADRADRVAELLTLTKGDPMALVLPEREAAQLLEAAPPGTTGDSEKAEATTTLAALPKDTIIFLNFWASWCQPCREELPSMFRLRKALDGKPFKMVGVSYDADWPAMTGFFDKWIGGQPDASKFLLLRDPATEPGTSLRERFGTTALPDTYILYNGRVLARFVNQREWARPAMVELFTLWSEMAAEGAR